MELQDNLCGICSEEEQQCDHNKDMVKTIIFIEGGQEQTKERKMSLKTKSVMENSIILENVQFAILNHDLRMEGKRSKHTMTTIINLWMSAGSAKNVTTNGTNTINQSNTQETQEPPQVVLISSTAGSRDHAKTYQLQDLEKAWKESEADYFSKSCDLSGKPSQPSFFSKMSLPYEHEDWTEFCKNLPKNGMIVGGLCYRLKKWELGTKEKDGSYLPTMGANEFKGSGRKRYRGSKEFRGAKMSEGLRTSEGDPIYIHPSFAEVVMGYPIGWSELKPLEIQ